MLDVVFPLDFVVIVATCGSRERFCHEIQEYQTYGEQSEWPFYRNYALTNSRRFFLRQIGIVRECNYVETEKVGKGNEYEGVGVRCNIENSSLHSREHR